MPNFNMHGYHFSHPSLKMVTVLETSNYDKRFNDVIVLLDFGITCHTTYNSYLIQLEQGIIVPKQTVKNVIFVAVHSNNNIVRLGTEHYFRNKEKYENATSNAHIECDNGVYSLVRIIGRDESYPVDDIKQEPIIIPINYK